MSRYIGSFYAALQDVIAETWPSVVGVWEDCQVERFPLEDMAKRGEIPLAVIQSDLEPTGEWGLANKVDEGIVSVYLIVPDIGPATVPQTLRPLLEDLRDALWPPPAVLGSGQVQGKASTKWGPDLAPNLYFLGKNIHYYCGLVTFRVLVGETGG